MTISDVYKKYDIMPGLAMHMLRTAAVADALAYASKIPVNRDDVVLAMLLHDMGNIIKSNLDILPELLEPEGRAYWEGIKNNFLKKYGSDEHIATEAIAKEIGASLRSLELIKSWSGFNHVVAIANNSDAEVQICAYSDLRVAPHGIVSLTARLDEAEKRYANHYQHIPDEKRSPLIDACYLLEKNLMEKSLIIPSDITEEALSAKIEELRSFPVPTMEPALVA